MVAPGNVRFGYPDFDELRVGGNLIWSPVSGLDIGAEVIYTNIQSDRNTIRIIPGGRIRDQEDTVEGRLRVQRDSDPRSPRRSRDEAPASRGLSLWRAIRPATQKRPADRSAGLVPTGRCAQCRGAASRPLDSVRRERDRLVCRGCRWSHGDTVQ